jgi:hypothetical protein
MNYTGLYILYTRWVVVFLTPKPLNEGLFVSVEFINIDNKVIIWCIQAFFWYLTQIWPTTVASFYNLS